MKKAMHGRGLHCGNSIFHHLQHALSLKLLWWSFRVCPKFCRLGREQFRDTATLQNVIAQRLVTELKSYGNRKQAERLEKELLAIK